MSNQELEHKVLLLEKLLSAIILSDRYSFGKDLELQNGRNLILATTNGTKIGTSATQKLAFFGATPVVRHSATGVRADTVAGGFNLTDTATWIGGIGSTSYMIGDVIKALKEYGLLAP